MGVCCIVFDIDGMLFELFMNFLNIEKNILRFVFFQYFMFYSRFMLFPTFKKKICKKNGRWFLQIVDGDSGNLHVYPIYPLFHLCIINTFYTGQFHN